MKEVARAGGESFVIDNLHFDYNANLPIFENLNINVVPGEFLAILGPSGCGKATLFNLSSG